MSRATLFNQHRLNHLNLKIKKKISKWRHISVDSKLAPSNLRIDGHGILRRNRITNHDDFYLTVLYSLFSYLGNIGLQSLLSSIIMNRWTMGNKLDSEFNVDFCQRERKSENEKEPMLNEIVENKYFNVGAFTDRTFDKVCEGIRKNCFWLLTNDVHQNKAGEKTT